MAMPIVVIWVLTSVIKATFVAFIIAQQLRLWLCSVQIVAREVLNQRLCFHHPHIIQFREVFLTADHLAIVSEYAAGGDLADYIDRHQAKHQQAGLTEDNALWLFHQLVTGVNFCHQVRDSHQGIMTVVCASPDCRLSTSKY